MRLGFFALALAGLLLCCHSVVAQTDAVAIPSVDGKGHLLAAKRRYEEIQSYRCTATNVIMKYGLVRTVRHFNSVDYSFQKPQNIRMTWTDPLLMRGQIAVFRDKELRVKLPFVPFAVRMDPDGFLAKDPAGNRIYHTHLGYVIDALLKSITPETKVTVEGPPREGLLPMAIENSQGRVLVKLDTDLGLPVFVEYYGPDGKLIEGCYFKDMALNVNFPPGEFDLSVKEN